MPDTTELTAPADTTATAAVITIDGPNDWLAAAAGHRVRYPHSGFGQHSRRQLDRTLAYLTHRVDGITAPEVTICRAARILRASLDAPRSECTLGIRLDDPVYDPVTAAAVVPLEPTAVIKPPRKRRPKTAAAARRPKAEDTAAGTAEAEAKAEEAQP